MTPRRETAIVFTAPGVAELQPVEPDFRPLGPHEMAGRTLCTLVSVGTELAVLLGKEFPKIVGYAAVFEVERVGTEVTDIQPGQRVFCLGPHRSFQRTDRASVIPVPENLSPFVALFARMMGVAMSTLTTTTARPPGKVLVTGLGLVGHLAARIFQMCGYEVAACDPLESRRELARAAGLKLVLEKPPLDDPEWFERVELVAECSGHEQAVLDGCNIVSRRGEVVLIGVPWRKQTELSAHDLLWAIFHKYAVVRSGWEWEIPLHPTPFRPGSLYGNMAAAMRWLAEGRLSVEGLAEVVSPTECGRVFQRLAEGTFPLLTAVFDWSHLG